MVITLDPNCYPEGKAPAETMPEAKTAAPAVPEAAFQVAKVEPAPTPAKHQLVKCELVSPAPRLGKNGNGHDDHEASTQQVLYRRQETFLDSVPYGQTTPSKADDQKTPVQDPTPRNRKQQTPTKALAHETSSQADYEQDTQVYEKKTPIKADDQKTQADEKKTPNKADDQKTEANEKKTPNEADGQKTEANEKKTPNKADDQKGPSATPSPRSSKRTPKSGGSMIGKRRRLAKSPDPMNEVPKDAAHAACPQIQIQEVDSVSVDRNLGYI